MVVMEEDLKGWSHVSVTVVIIATSVLLLPIGVFLNWLITTSVVKNSKLWTPANILLSMRCADQLTLTGLWLPLFTTTVILADPDISPNRFVQKSICRVVVLGHGLFFGAVHILCCVSATIRCLHATQYLSLHRISPVNITIVAIVALVVALMPYLVRSIYIPPLGSNTCGGKLENFFNTKIVAIYDCIYHIFLVVWYFGLTWLTKSYNRERLLPVLECTMHMKEITTADMTTATFCASAVLSLIPIAAYPIMMATEASIYTLFSFYAIHGLICHFTYNAVYPAIYVYCNKELKKKFRDIFAPKFSPLASSLASRRIQNAERKPETARTSQPNELPTVVLTPSVPCSTNSTRPWDVKRVW